MTPEFLYYVLSSDQFFSYDVQNSHGAKMPRGSKEAVMKYRFPVPPLEVQCEIVHILDSFTLLTAELTAELTARKKQYEFYRDNLLKYSNGFRKGKIIDMLIQPITDGPHTTPVLVDEGIPFLSAEAVCEGAFILKRNGDILQKNLILSVVKI
ncbi:MAG: restriction endonuclease subunit S [Coprococcus sp.]